MKRELIEFIKRVIEERGEISFDEFMELALYHPRWGYYSTGDVIGKRGDYYTSSDVHPIFGWTIGKFFIELWKREEKPDEFNLVEIGPGKGFLSYDILQYIERNAPNFYLHLSLYLIERSPAMERRLKETFSSIGDKIFIHRDFSNIDKISGIVYCNELFDALPVKRFFYRGKKWNEIVVILRGGEFKEGMKPVKNPFMLKVLSGYEKYIEDGGCVEWSPETFKIIKEVSEILERGYFIILDYGEKREELVSRFPKGSLAGYYKHMVTSNPYERIGEQDLTFHIDFTLLEEILRTSGFEIIDYKDQGKFLLESGIMQILEEVERGGDTVESLKARLAMKSLVLDFSSDYRVLISRKG
jgi:SAM-dependent MidA family methyltransferase